MDRIVIDSSDEENVAPNGHDGRPATPEIPGCALARFTAPPRRATPRLMSESSDESPPASPPQRAAPAAQRPMSESSDESPPTSPPTPPRPSGRSISPFYVDGTGRKIPCSEAPPARLDFLNLGYTGSYRGPSDANAPLAFTSQQALRIIDQTYDNAPLASTSQHALRIIDQTYDDAPLASSSQASIPTADETTEQGYQPTGKAMQWEAETSDSETEAGQKFRRKEAQPPTTAEHCRAKPSNLGPPPRDIHRKQRAAQRRPTAAPLSTRRSLPSHSTCRLRRSRVRSLSRHDGHINGGARAYSRGSSTGVNPRLGPDCTSDSGSPGHHRRRGPTSSAAHPSPSPCGHHRRRGPTSSPFLCP
nr:COPII coat assembly protein SEC16-like [Drosophila kikkawai]